MRVALCLFGIVLFAYPGISATFHVPDNYLTIQDAISASVNGDVIIVRQGTYRERLFFLGKSIHVLGEAGPALTVVDGERNGHVVSFRDREPPTTILEGFTITNGYSMDGGGIYCYASVPLIRNCIISGNEAGDDGGGIYCTESCAPTLMNVIIARNTAAVAGGGIHSYLYSRPHFVNCTISENSAGYFGGGVYCFHNGYASIENAIVWDNSAPQAAELSGSGCTVTYSDVKNGWGGAGNIVADPLFVDPKNGDYHLTWGSPCLNAGNTGFVTELSDFEGDPRVVMGGVDMGADEFHPHLYSVGDVVPGGYVSLRATGYPGAWVWFARGAGVLDPPVPTKYGTIHLRIPLVNDWTLGVIPPSGVLKLPVRIPSTWLPGEWYFYQAMVGPRPPFPAAFTNHLAVTVD